MIRKGRVKRYLALLIAGSMVLSTGMVASAEENPGVNIQTGTGQTQNTETEVQAAAEERATPAEELGYVP